MVSKEIKDIIEIYIESYHSFEIERMVELLHKEHHVQEYFRWGNHHVINDKVEVGADTLQLKEKSQVKIKKGKISMIEDYS